MSNRHILTLVSTFLILPGLLGAATLARAQEAPHVVLPPEGPTAAVPVGGDAAGGAEADAAVGITGQTAPSDIAAGQNFFVKLNCAGCHGYDGKGGMGPNLTDRTWIFGGTPAAIFKSIYEGRPQGMPAWGTALPARDIWQLVAYVVSLGGAVDAKDYQPALQGDEPGELVAPELAFEQSLDGSPADYPPADTTPPAVPYPAKQP
ncbi:MAG: c-type cytochrome [Devosia sp.]